MKLPNFLIIGASRSGTSSLHNYLNQHPQVFFPIFKEPSFFSYDPNDPKVVDHYKHMGKAYGFNLITSMNDYVDLFKRVTSEAAIGEASTNYLHFPKSAKNIKNTLPNAKIIVSLRNPVEGSYSLYNWAYMHQLVGTPFHELSEADQDDVIGNLVSMDFNPYYYYRHLKKYFEQFDREQILVLIFEEWTRKAPQTMENLYNFLEIDSSFQPTLEIIWQSNLIRSNKAGFFLKRVVRKVGKLISPVAPNLSRTLGNISDKKFIKKPPPLSASSRQKIYKIYREDIDMLEKLIDKDLSLWREE